MRLFLAIISLFFILNSCSSVKHVPDNKYLLIENIIELQEDEKISKYEVKRILKQRPNKEILNFFKFYLSIYNLTNKEKNNRLNRYLKKMGEAPVILDEELTKKSKLQIERYFRNAGYYNNIVTTKTEYKNQKAKVTYNILLGKYYLINTISYPVLKNEKLNQKINYQKNELIGQKLNSQIIDDERKRISRIMKNNGYFNFSKEQITALTDTALTENSISLKILIDTTNKQTNKKYYLKNINIIIDKDSIKTTKIKDNIHFTNLTEDIKTKTLQRALKIQSGSTYSLNDIEETRSNLSNLKIFKSIYINFSEIENTDSLDCNIFLNKQKKMYYSLEAEGTNSSGNGAISLKLKFGNKNIFKGAENFHFKFKGSLEARQNLKISESFFNTWEIGAETFLKIPRLVAPKPIRNIFQNTKSPNTNFSFSFMKQQRPDFTRSILKTTLFGYNFNAKKNLTYFLNLAEFSYIKMFNESSDFQQQYLTNDFFSNQYNDHLITGSSYTVIYNNQKINKLQNYSFIKTRFEMSGLTLNALANLTKFQQDSLGNYTLFENRFTQYIIGELDLRKYFIINKENGFALRAYIGIGFPYGNSEHIPAQKQFFGGGTNGLRAWRAFSLGPGSYKDFENNSINYFLGDIKIESSIEYRFPLFNIGSYKVKGALFSDFGNIWRLQETPEQPGSKFDKNFLSEMAIGVGVGFRWDIKFLIIRFDLATPIRNPYKINNTNWIENPLNKALEGNLTLNIGIGYPF